MRDALLIARKDLLAEYRKKESIVSMVFFGFLLLVMLNIAVGVGRELDGEMAAGILWVSIIFSAVLGLGRVLSKEKENRCIDALLLSPVEPEQIYAAKTMVNFIFMAVAEAVLIPAFFVLYGDRFARQVPMLVVVVLLVNIGFSTVGTLFSAITAGTRRNEVLLPLLLFPVITPLMALAVKVTGGLFEDLPYREYSSWLYVIAAFGLIFSGVGYLLFEFVIKEG
ncbi:MAG TPA: cytochrome C biogenesis protein [Nitrospirae bacterium]|nr:cytochrome C biogenesis protein [Nitrospirota bacterium]